MGVRIFYHGYRCDILNHIIIICANLGQTYYITLDLTLPDSTQNRPPLPNSKEQNIAKPRWLNPTLQRKRGSVRSTQKRDTAPIPQTHVSTATPSGFDIGSESKGGGAEDNIMQDFALQNIQAAAKNMEEEMRDLSETIQVLDFESDNPIVSYKGHIYSMSWTQNLGTELLFTNHNAHKPLPVLRSLDDDVDLLAASSVRLISKEIKLVPRQQSEADMLHKLTYKPTNVDGIEVKPPFRINLGRDVPQEKHVQATFLEKLAAIKKSKGETDEVSVVTSQRPTQRGWRQIIRQRKRHELKDLKAKLATAEGYERNLQSDSLPSSNGHALNHLRAQITELEDVLEGWETYDRENGVGRKRGREVSESAIDNVIPDAKRGKAMNRGRGKRRAKGSASLAWAARSAPQAITGRGTGFSMGLSHGVFDLGGPSYGRESLSTPTPGRWDDLISHRGDDAVAHCASQEEDDENPKI